MSGFQLFFRVFDGLFCIFNIAFFCGFIRVFVGFVFAFLNFLSFTRFVVFFCFFKFCFRIAFGLVFDTHIFFRVVFFLLRLFFSGRVKVVRCVFHLFVSLFDICTGFIKFIVSTFGLVSLLVDLGCLIFGICFFVGFSLFFSVYIICFISDFFRCSTFCLFKVFFNGFFVSSFDVFIFLRLVKLVFSLTRIFCFLVSIFSAIYSAFFSVR